jgi:predicted LPLAT superfamily acyltransferase
MSATESPSPSGASAPSWTGRSRGGYFGNWFFVQLIRLVGLRAAYVWLVLIAGYYTLTSPRAFRSSVEFLRRLSGPRPFWVWPILVYRHFYSFGVTLLDRIAVIMGRARMECVFEGEAVFQDLLNRGQGFILVGAHLGNWEMAAHLLGRFGRPINLIVLEREESNIRKLFDQALQSRQFRILTADDNPLRTIPILAALRRGEVVGMLGDRSFGGAETAVPFLGGTARFPVGPYHLAAVTGAPLFQVFAVREKLGKYRFFYFPAQHLSRDTLRRGPEAVTPLVAEYARRLESVARQYPFQWHNFYPFWDPPAARPEP